MAFSTVTDGEDNCVELFYPFPTLKGDSFDVMKMNNILYFAEIQNYILNKQILTND